MRALIFLLVIFCASPAFAGPTAKRLLSVMNTPTNGPFTTEVTGAFSIPISWYQDSAATTQGSLTTLLGGGGGGQTNQGGAGYAGDRVDLSLTPANYTAYKGYGGEGGHSAAAGSVGGAGYVAGTNGTLANSAGGGSSAIKNSSNALVAQAKGGTAGGGAAGGGTSSGGAVTAGGGAAGGPTTSTTPAEGNPGGNGGVFLRYYTDPGNFQLTTFATGNEGWTFSPTTTAAVVSGVATLSEDSYNTNEYSVQKTITTRAGVMSAMIGASDGGNSGVTGQFKVTIGGTTYNLNSMSTTKYEFNVPAGSTTIKFWFTGHALYHYSMSVDDIKIPVP